MRCSSRYLPLVLSISVLLAVGLPALAATPPPPVCGDCDGDGAVNIVDAQIAATGSGPVGQCDIDLNGTVNFNDGFAIAQWSAGLTIALFCPAGTPSISRVDPFDPACGTCITGASTGQPFSIRLFSNTQPGSPLVPNTGLQRGASAVAMAQAVSAMINNNTNYTSTVYSGNCLLLQDSNNQQAFLDIFGTPGNCTPGLGAPCVGYF